MELKRSVTVFYSPHINPMHLLHPTHVDDVHDDDDEDDDDDNEYDDDNDADDCNCLLLTLSQSNANNISH